MRTLVLAALCCWVGVAQAQQSVTAAGGAFAAPVLAEWGKQRAAASRAGLDYRTVGSLDGENLAINGGVDFASVDAPVGVARLASAKLMQFPLAFGAVFPVVNLPGLGDGRLKLTGEVLADIYLGRITRWNDSRLAEINRGLTLPALAIRPLHRGDGSAETAAFTAYLSAVSGDWRRTVGTFETVPWPLGEAFDGGAGMVAGVSGTRGAIGYVDNGQAAGDRLASAQLRNKSGEFVRPTATAVAAAAAAADWADAQDFAPRLIDLPAAGAWPIVAAAFALVPRAPADPARATAAMGFLDWALASGGESAGALGYVVPPANVQDAVRAGWRTEIRGPRGQPVYR